MMFFNCCWFKKRKSVGKQKRSDFEIENEDQGPEFKKFHETYKIISFAMVVGLIYPNKKTEKCRVMYIALSLLSITPVAIILFIDMYQCYLRRDFIEIIRHSTVFGPFMGGFLKMFLMFYKRVECKQLIDEIESDYKQYNERNDVHKNIIRASLQNNLKYSEMWWAYTVVGCVMTFPVMASVLNLYNFTTKMEPNKYMIHELNKPGGDPEARYDTPYFELMYIYMLYCSMFYVVNFLGYDGFFGLMINHACLKMTLYCQALDDAMKVADKEDMYNRIIRVIKEQNRFFSFVELIQETFNIWLGIILIATMIQICNCMYHIMEVPTMANRIRIWMILMVVLNLALDTTIAFTTALPAVVNDESSAKATTSSDETTSSWNILPRASSRVEPSPDRCRPLVIAHRGASGYVPEHTLGSYALAVIMGADYVEPDLVMTSDGHLVARHDNELGLTTDVAKRLEFADRFRTITIDGYEMSGWFTEDFTLAELKTLRVIERIPEIRPGNARLDGAFDVPTFQEIIDLVKSLQISQRRVIGIYPEIKHSTHFRRLGLAMERPLIEILHKNGYHGYEDPIIIQSFEINNLKELRNMTSIKLLQLYYSDKSVKPVGQSELTYGDMSTPEGLREVAKYATAVGPDKGYIIPRDANNTLGAATSFVRDAHAAGLEVHPYAFRAENYFLPEEFTSKDHSEAARGDLSGELKAFFAAGVDGIFSDQPDIPFRLRGICV